MEVALTLCVSALVAALVDACARSSGCPPRPLAATPWDDADDVRMFPHD